MTQARDWFVYGLSFVARCQARGNNELKVDAILSLNQSPLTLTLFNQITLTQQLYLRLTNQTHQLFLSPPTIDA